MKRITRDRRLTPEEAAKNKSIREQVAGELPDLIARHHERVAALDQLQDLLAQLKSAREAKGLSLANLTELTKDRSWPKPVTARPCYATLNLRLRLRRGHHHISHEFT